MLCAVTKYRQKNQQPYKEGVINMEGQEYIWLTIFHNW